MILIAVLAVVMLLLSHHVPGGLKMMTQVKMIPLSSRFGMGLITSPHKNMFVQKLLKLETGWKQQI
jgi:hypothetical protein